jgi:hypothetical protein
VSVSKRVISIYVAWGLAAFGTTLTWTNRPGFSENGLTPGHNGQLVIILAATAVGLLAWWDKGNHLVSSQLKVASFAFVLALLVLVRNAYDINDAGRSIGVGLWLSLICGVLGVGLVASLPRR